VNAARNLAETIALGTLVTGNPGIAVSGLSLTLRVVGSL